MRKYCLGLLASSIFFGNYLFGQNLDSSSVKNNFSGSKKEISSFVKDNNLSVKSFNYSKKDPSVIFFSSFQELEKLYSSRENKKDYPEDPYVLDSFINFRFKFP